MNQITLMSQQLIPLIAEIRKLVEICLCSRRIGGKITFKNKDNLILRLQNYVSVSPKEEKAEFWKDSTNSIVIWTL